MINSQIKKVIFVFGGIFAFCIVYSLIYRSINEPFTNDIPIKTCKKDSDCPDKFKCNEQKKCQLNSPFP
jgi:hypothetical protein